jgi:PAS domain S-box-containing protein
MPFVGFPLNQHTDAIIVCDQFGIISLWNAGAERIFGYRKEETLDSSVSMLIPNTVLIS